jgi:hypothetical protein
MWRIPHDRLLQAVGPWVKARGVADHDFDAVSALERCAHRFDADRLEADIELVL